MATFDFKRTLTSPRFTTSTFNAKTLYKACASLGLSLYCIMTPCLSMNIWCQVLYGDTLNIYALQSTRSDITSQTKNGQSALWLQKVTYLPRGVVLDVLSFLNWTPYTFKTPLLILTLVGVDVIDSQPLQNQTFKLTPLLLLTPGVQHSLLIDAQASNRGNTVWWVDILYYPYVWSIF